MVFNKSRMYFINYAVFVNATNLGLIGDYVIKIGVVDAWMRSKNESIVATIDPNKPVLETIEFSDGEISYNEFLEVSWYVTDENFDMIEFYVEDRHVYTSYSPATSVRIGPEVWILPEGYTRFLNDVKVVIRDRAGNTVEYEYQIEYVDDRYGYVSDEELRERNIKLTWNVIIAVVLFSLIVGLLIRYANERGKEREDMSRPNIIRRVSTRIAKRGVDSDG
jgi:hypothetical protein